MEPQPSPSTREGGGEVEDVIPKHQAQYRTMAAWLEPAKSLVDSLRQDEERGDNNCCYVPNDEKIHQESSNECSRASLNLVNNTNKFNNSNNNRDRPLPLLLSSAPPCRSLVTPQLEQQFDGNRRQLAASRISDLITRVMSASTSSDAVPAPQSPCQMSQSLSAPSPRSKPSIADNAVERLKSAYLSRMVANCSPQPSRQASSLSITIDAKSQKIQPQQGAIEIPISASGRPCSQQQQRTRPVSPASEIDSRQYDDVSSPDAFLSREDPRDRFQYASEVFATKANNSVTTASANANQGAATASPSSSVPGSSHQSAFGPILASLRKATPPSPQKQPGAVGIPIAYSTSPSTPPAPSVGSGLRKVPNRPRSPARFADIGPLNVCDDDNDDNLVDIFNNEAVRQQLAQMSTAKRIIYTANANRGNLLPVASRLSSTRPSDEEIDEKMQSLSSRPRSRLLSRKDDQVAATNKAQQQHHIPISLVSKPDSSKQPESAVAAASDSSADSNLTSSSSLKGEGTLERRIHHRNQLLKQQPPAPPRPQAPKWPSTTISDSTNKSTPQPANTPSSKPEETNSKGQLVPTEKLAKPEQPAVQPSKTQENEENNRLDRLDYFYHVPPPPSILEDYVEETTVTTKKRRVRFNRAPIVIMNTFSANDYDRRNEDVDPIAASAEYELEKLVERMSVQEVVLEKGPDGLGLSIISMGVGANCGVEKVGIFVKKITEDGAAEKDGRIKAFDFIIEVDGQSLVGVTQAFAGEVLRSTGDHVRLTIGREKEPEKSEVVRLIKKSLDKEEKQAQARRDIEAEEKRLEELKDRIRKSREEEESLDDEMKRLATQSAPCAPAATRRFVKKDSSESPPRNSGPTPTSAATSASTPPTASSSSVASENSGKDSKRETSSTSSGSQQNVKNSNSHESFYKDDADFSDIEDAPSRRLDEEDYDQLYAKYKEVQYRNAVAEAELAKVKAKIILLENAECQRAHYEQKCDEMASRLRESERALSQAHGDLQTLQTRLESDQQLARRFDSLEADWRQLERKSKKQKLMIKNLQQRESELTAANEALQSELDQRDRSYKRTIAVLNGQLSHLESSLGHVQQMAGLSSSRGNSLTRASPPSEDKLAPRRRHRSTGEGEGVISGISDVDDDVGDVDDVSLSGDSNCAETNGYRNGTEPKLNGTQTLFVGDTEGYESALSSDKDVVANRGSNTSSGLNSSGDSAASVSPPPKTSNGEVNNKRSNGVKTLVSKLVSEVSSGVETAGSSSNSSSPTNGHGNVKQPGVKTVAKPPVFAANGTSVRRRVTEVLVRPSSPKTELHKVAVPPGSPSAPRSASPAMKRESVSSNYANISEADARAAERLSSASGVSASAGFMFNVYEWSCHEVEHWLQAQKQGHLSVVFAAHRVDGIRLMKMATSEMKQIGIAKESDRAMLKKKIRQLEDVMKMERKLLDKERRKRVLSPGGNSRGTPSSAISAPATPAGTTPVTSAANSPVVNRKTSTSSINDKLPISNGWSAGMKPRSFLVRRPPGSEVEHHPSEESYADAMAFRRSMRSDSESPKQQQGFLYQRNQRPANSMAAVNNAGLESPSRLHRFFRRK